MANLKRNMIELVGNPEEVLNGGEVEIQRFWTPPFLPLTVVREAMELQKEIQGGEEEEELKLVDRMIEFIANRIYNKQFTVDDVYNKLHAPDAVQTLQEQVLFIVQGNQTDETKKFLAKKLS